MKRAVRNIVLSLLAITFVVVAIRFAFLASQCETAKHEIANQWKYATIGWFGWEHRRIDQRDPDQQAVLATIVSDFALEFSCSCPVLFIYSSHLWHFAGTLTDS